MGCWNYRVMKTVDEYGEEYYAIHEVHYHDHPEDEHDDNDPRAATKNPVDVGGESIDSLRWILEEMLACLDKPVLTNADFPDHRLKEGYQLIVEEEERDPFNTLGK